MLFSCLIIFYEGLIVLLLNGLKLVINMLVIIFFYRNIRKQSKNILMISSRILVGIWVLIIVFLFGSFSSVVGIILKFVVIGVISVLQQLENILIVVIIVGLLLCCRIKIGMLILVVIIGKVVKVLFIIIVSIVMLMVYIVMVIKWLLIVRQCLVSYEMLVLMFVVVNSSFSIVRICGRIKVQLMELSKWCVFCIGCVIVLCVI